MRIVHFAHEGRSIAAPFAGDRLLVRRGRTHFPVRPLSVPRFLIGSGTNCHLQLGGGLPMLHSMIVREEGRWVIEAIAPEPALIVNGVRRRRQVLCMHDVIGIGEFELVLFGGDDGTPGELPAADERIGRKDRSASSEVVNGCGPSIAALSELLPVISEGLGSTAPIEQQAAGLTAGELVDCLEREFRLIDRLGHTRRAAGTALLRAIRRQGRSARIRAA